jgi:hypothetical protein
MSLRQASNVATIIERFKMGALLVDEARENFDADTEIEGIKMIRESLKELDTPGPDGRNALVPLLDDPAPAIRAYAAGALVKIVPDRALTVLHEIRDRCLTVAHLIAGNLLILHEHGGLTL